MIIVNDQGNIIFYNKLIKKLFVHKLKEFLGQNVKSLIDIDLSTQQTDFEMKLNGIYVKLSKKPIDINGKIGFILVFEDITNLKKAIHEKKQLDAIIESSYDGIYITDCKGKTLKVNSAYERISGIKREDLLNKNVYDLVERGMFSEVVTKEVVKTKKSVSKLQSIKDKQRVLVTGSPIFNDKGLVEIVVTNVRDLSTLYDLKEKLEKARKLTKDYETQIEKLKAREWELNNVIAHSFDMKKILKTASQISDVNSTVLIQGESGVGKEIVAKIIHKGSRKSTMPFIKVNCGAIPENLLEAELFGYEKGAFTGAKYTGKPGLFELANEGTVFLDEIGEMPLNLQVKLLRVLQDKEFFRVGGTNPIKVDFRIIAATNRNLENMISKGEFRKDLYYRLNVIPLYIPPLRERPEDIPPLIFYFLNKYNNLYNRKKTITPETIEILNNYQWPGNVRELQNIIERLVVTVESDIIKTSDLPENLIDPENEILKEIHVNSIIPLEEALEELEKQLVEKAYRRYRSSYKVAKVLNISQPTAYRRIKKYITNS